MKHDHSLSCQIEALARLEDGWLDGQGCAPSEATLGWLSAAIGAAMRRGLPLPYLYPTVEGGVQAEWDVGQWAITLDINLIDKSGKYQSLNLATHACCERDLDLSTDWVELYSMLAMHDESNPKKIEDIQSGLQS